MSERPLCSGKPGYVDWRFFKRAAVRDRGELASQTASPFYQTPAFVSIAKPPSNLKISTLLEILRLANVKTFKKLGSVLEGRIHLCIFAQYGIYGGRSDFDPHIWGLERSSREKGLEMLKLSWGFVEV